MLKSDNHIFSGLQRDLDIAKHKPEFLWDAHNIRLTTRGNNTLLAVTNEKGTAKIKTDDNNEGLIKGKYLGHCVLNNILIVFTKGKNIDYIYKITKVEDNYTVKKLVEYNLNFNLSYPIETLGVYENNNIQKVYWTDGYNQPRFIILNREYTNINITTFDFTQRLILNESIAITKLENGGSFAPGVIQYAFSYYNKYGAESNLFYTSGLYYITASDRGLSPEEKSSNVFKIRVNNVDINFDFIRIYSIHRTSLDDVPTVKRIIDLPTSNSVLYTDMGTTGDTIDPTTLLYIGGENIIAQTMCQKDNTLFLGNLKIVRNSIPDNIVKELRDPSTQCYVSSRTVHKFDFDGSSFYPYDYKLDTNITTFKCGDIYRLGLQFQYYSGKWSEPIWVKDYEIPRSKRPMLQLDHDRTNQTLLLPQITVGLKKSIIKELINLGYKKVRGVVVFPTLYERMTLAQGVLCPTVFSVNSRVSNAPFAQSSWFFRPMYENDNIKEEPWWVEELEPEKGAYIPFKHLDRLVANNRRGCEIQNIQSLPFNEINPEIRKGKSYNSFYVDQSVVTFHSPDIEFDDSVKQAINNNEFEVDIVGLTQFTSSVGDIKIQTSTPPQGMSDEGVVHKSTINVDSGGVSTGLISGFFYRGHPTDDGKDASNFGTWNGDNISWYDTNWELGWMVYPWHRQGSLNNDIVRPEGKGIRTSVLKKKTISNLRFSRDNMWFVDFAYYKMKGITPISIFDNDQISLIKLPTPKNSDIKAINYYGNVDTLLSSPDTFTFAVSNYGDHDFNGIVQRFESMESTRNVGDYAPALKYSKDPVRMKYKSTPHAVFALDYAENDAPTILPRVGELNKVDEEVAKIVPFWSTKKIKDDVITDPVVEIKYQLYNGLLNIDYFKTPEEKKALTIQFLTLHYPNPGNDNYAIAPSIQGTSLTAFSFKSLYKSVSNAWIYVDPEDNKVYKVPTDSNGYYRKSIANNGGLHLEYIYNPNTQIYKTKQDNINERALEGSLFLAEIRRKDTPENMFGGISDDAFKANLWLPAGEPTLLNTGFEVLNVNYTYGDTYYQRYDCLKTYPFTNEDENSIVEIASFMCETRVNLDGRYDRNRAQVNNLNITPRNFNLLNTVYSQRNTFFNYRFLDKDYYNINTFPTSITWSLEKHNSEIVDTWTKINLSSIMDLDGSKGSINALRTFNDNIICFQDSGISNILFNSRVQIPVSDGVPVEISNSGKVEGNRYISNTVGCINKWSIVDSISGLYFVDNLGKNIYNIGSNGLNSVSTVHSMNDWISAQNPFKWNTSNYDGIRACYDNNYNDVYFITNTNSLVFSESLGQFTSFMDYASTVLFNINSDFFAIKNEGDNCRIWQMFKGEYNKFFNEYKPFKLTFISNADSSLDKIFTNIDIRADFYNNNLEHRKLFDYIRVWNEFQDSGKVPLTFSNAKPSNLKKKFRIWRVTIPRDKTNKLNRIRNTWTKIELGMNDIKKNDENINMILHDLGVQYYI